MAEFWKPKIHAQSASPCLVSPKAAVFSYCKCSASVDTVDIADTDDTVDTVESVEAVHTLDIVHTVHTLDTAAASSLSIFMTL